jgi:hypothetical protein
VDYGSQFMRSCPKITFVLRTGTYLHLALTLTSFLRLVLKIGSNLMIVLLKSKCSVTLSKKFLSVVAVVLLAV